MYTDRCWRLGSCGFCVSDGIAETRNGWPLRFAGSLRPASTLMLSSSCASRRSAHILLLPKGQYSISWHHKERTVQWFLPWLEAFPYVYIYIYMRICLYFDPLNSVVVCGVFLGLFAHAVAQKLLTANDFNFRASGLSSL